MNLTISVCPPRRHWKRNTVWQLYLWRTEAAAMYPNTLRFPNCMGAQPSNFETLWYRNSFCIIPFAIIASIHPILAPYIGNDHDHNRNRKHRMVPRRMSHRVEVQFTETAHNRHDAPPVTWHEMHPQRRNPQAITCYFSCSDTGKGQKSVLSCT